MITLKSLREDADLSAEEVARRGAAMDPDFPTTPHAIYNIERRGTDSYATIRVLAKLYGKKPEEVAEVARPTKPVPA